MIPLALGLAVLAAALWAANAVSRASVASVKSFIAWLAALAGLALAALLFLSGRESLAISGLVFAGPLLLNFWRENRGGGPGPTAAGPGAGRSAPPRRGVMSRKEALEILGLHDGVSDSDVRAAWVRVMRGVHPDHGGTDWIAARVNQARDTLLRRG